MSETNHTHQPTKFDDLRSVVLVTLLAVACFVSRLAIPYFAGRSNSLWFPADILPAFLCFIICVVLLWEFAVSVVSKRHTVAVGLMFLIAVVCSGAGFLVRSAAIFQRGFARYARTVLTPDEWRSIARFVQEHIKSGGMLPGPRKNLWTEKEHMHQRKLNPEFAYRFYSMKKGETGIIADGFQWLLKSPWHREKRAAIEEQIRAKHLRKPPMILSA